MSKTKRSAKDPNEIVEYNDYAEIILYDKYGEECARAIIDLDDNEKCSLYKWSYRKNNNSHKGYARNKDAGYLHRYVTNCIDDMIVDHINGNRLDNRKENLRLCTMKENRFNNKNYSTNKSGYPGVSWHKKAGKWRARIQVQEKQIHLGLFDSLEEAIAARQQAEIDYFGEYRRQ
jgi:hypothetical protein